MIASVMPGLSLMIKWFFITPLYQLQDWDDTFIC